MNIPGLSILLNQSNLQQQVDLSLMKQAMNTSEANVTDLIDMLEQSPAQAPHPTLGKQLDIKA